MAKKQPMLSVFLRLPNGNGSLLTLSPSTSLATLINKLKNTSIELPQTYRLVIRGQRVKDYSQTLKQAGVQQHSIIHIEPETINQKSNIKIDVAFLVGGEKWVVKISREETIWALKTSIYYLISINPKQQILVYLGKKLKNHKTLRHYKITSDCLLSLIVDSAERLTPFQKHFQHYSINLINSVCSLEEKKSGTSNTSLFRSDSINTRKTEDMVPYEIMIHQKVREMRAMRECQAPHCVDLFNSCKNATELKDSFTFHSLFESAGLMKQHQSFQQDQDEDELKNLDQTKFMLKKIQSLKSLEISEDQMMLQ